MRLLVVEDETRLARLLRRALIEEGHAVDLASSGEDGIDWMSVGDYDAILLDVMLPGIDGFEVCRRLRRNAIHTPILILNRARCNCRSRARSGHWRRRLSGEALCPR